MFRTSANDPQEVYIKQVYIYIYIYTHTQSAAEPADTFQMVTDNIRKKSETVYKYVPVCYLLPTDYKLIF